MLDTLFGAFGAVIILNVIFSVLRGGLPTTETQQFLFVHTRACLVEDVSNPSVSPNGVCLDLPLEARPYVTYKAWSTDDPSCRRLWTPGSEEFLPQRSDSCLFENEPPLFVSHAGTATSEAAAFASLLSYTDRLLSETTRLEIRLLNLSNLINLMRASGQRLALAINLKGANTDLQLPLVILSTTSLESTVEQRGHYTVRPNIESSPAIDGDTKAVFAHVFARPETEDAQ